MKTGFPNHPRKNILKEIEWIGKNGFDFVDLFLEEDEAVPEKIDAGKVKKLLQKYNLDVVGHTAWYLPIGSPVKSFREAAVLEAKRYLEVFGKLGVKYVTIHARWPSSMFKPEEGIKWQVESLKKLVKLAKNYNVNIMLEPVDSHLDTIENIEKILNGVPELYLHIDIGHANVFGRDPEEFIKKFHKKLKHIHLHDNDGNKDQHLPMGTGSIKWPNVIKTLKKHYDGTITLEVFSRDKDYVLLSKKKLVELWKKS